MTVPEKTSFGDRLYRKRYLLTVIADRSTDDGDDWAAYISDGLGGQHCFWDVEEVENVELTEAAELPAELERILRDPAVVVDRDHEIKLADGRSLFEHLAEWRDAPSNTASAD